MTMSHIRFAFLVALSIQTVEAAFVAPKLQGVSGATTEALGIALGATSVYVTGVTDGNLGGETKTGSQDLFFTKYDHTGAAAFTKLLGVAGANADVAGLDVDDAEANVYIVGYTNGNLGGQTKTGAKDMFLTKYSTAGVNAFTKLMGVVSAETEASGVVVGTGASPAIYVVGYTSGTLNSQTKTGDTDSFVTKYDAAGSATWTKLQGVASSITRGLAITETSDVVYVTGTTNGNLDSNTKAGTDDLFVSQYSSGGGRGYTKLQGVSGATAQPSGITIGTGGKLYVVGVTNGNLGGNTKTGTSDAFIAEFTASTGAAGWTKLFGVASASTAGSSLSQASSSPYNLYLSGETGGSLGGVTVTGTSDIFVQQFTVAGATSGTPKLAGVAGAATAATGGALGTNGVYYVVGVTAGNLGGVTKVGTTDMFLAADLPPTPAPTTAAPTNTTTPASNATTTPTTTPTGSFSGVSRVDSATVPMVIIALSSLALVSFKN